MEHSQHSSSTNTMGMDMGGHRCSMNMVWNTNPMNVCLVFPQLQITSTPSLIFYLSFLTILSFLFEYTRLLSSSHDRSLRHSLRGQLPPPTSSAISGSLSASGGRRPSRASSPNPTEEALLGSRGGRLWGVVKLPMSIQFRRSALYVFNVALAYYLMLIAMTYNAYLISAVLLGAFLGHFSFTRTMDLGAQSEDDGRGVGGCH